MSRGPDYRGVRFGRLFALRRVKTEKGARWFCFCLCGGRALVESAALRKGTTKSCGCLRREKAREAREARSAKAARRAEAEEMGIVPASSEPNEHQEALDDALQSLGLKSYTD